MSEFTIVAPVGWWDLADASSFYPPDLPVDWQLSYFANAFGAVVLPYRDWTGIAPESLAQWPDDVAARFRFIAEAGGETPGAREAETRLARTLGPALSTWLSADASAALSTAPADQASALSPLRSFPCWPAGDQETPDAQGPRGDQRGAPGRKRGAAGYAVLAPVAVHGNLRAARRWLDALIAQHGSAPAVIILARPSSAELEAWHRLVDLLGLVRAPG